MSGYIALLHRGSTTLSHDGSQKAPCQGVGMMSRQEMTFLHLDRNGGLALTTWLPVDQIVCRAHSAHGASAGFVRASAFLFPTMISPGSTADRGAQTHPWGAGSGYCGAHLLRRGSRDVSRRPRWSHRAGGLTASGCLHLFLDRTQPFEQSAMAHRIMKRLL